MGRQATRKRSDAKTPLLESVTGKHIL